MDSEKLSLYNLAQKVRERYAELFGTEPLLIRAPGRINLIGEHTDYNNGFVLPAAVSQSILFAIGKSKSSDKCTISSMDFGVNYEFNISEMTPLPSGSWQNYILGVVSEIQKSGRMVSGFNIVFSGNVPQGAGMSSSAALECGTCFGLNELFQLDISRVEMVKISQLAEHNYVGVKCGIMDQFASMMGKSEHALMLDCRSLDYSYFPIGLTDYQLVLFNSQVTHSLANSEYNVRREQCEEGVRVLQQSFPEIASLRDATMKSLMEVRSDMDELVFMRCKYIVEENERVKEFTKALIDNDLRQAGQILNRAHHAMRYEYEITCPEIDFIADYLCGNETVLGARMMGGGFGGCVLSLIRSGTQAVLLEGLNTAYKQVSDKPTTLIEVSISDGVSGIELTK